MGENQAVRVIALYLLPFIWGGTGLLIAWKAGDRWGTVYFIGTVSAFVVIALGSVVYERGRERGRRESR